MSAEPVTVIGTIVDWCESGDLTPMNLCIRLGLDPHATVADLRAARTAADCRVVDLQTELAMANAEIERLRAEAESSVDRERTLAASDDA